MTEHSSAFERLQAFLTTRMRMSHLYQRVMLKVLLEAGGRASIRDIAAAFLHRDESQLEYYGEITKRMPGPVLSRHGLVQRDGDGYRLIPDVERMSPEERDAIAKLCDDAVEGYLAKRGVLRLPAMAA